MKKLSSTIVLALVLSLVPAHAAVDEYTYSEAWFHSLLESDRKQIQSELASVGTYGGFCDGVFGKDTYRSIVKFESRSGLKEDGILNEFERNKLKELALEYDRSIGLSQFNDRRARLSLMLPTQILGESKEVDGGHEWKAKENVFFLQTQWMNYTGNSFLNTYKDGLKTKGVDVTFSTFKPKEFVITGKIGVAKFYTRAIDIGGSVIGFWAVYSGDRARDIDRIVVKISNSLTLAESEIIESDVAPPSAQIEGERLRELERQAKKVVKTQSGTGFYVSGTGHLLTNAHVVADCRSARVKFSDGRTAPAKIQNYDRDSDLAILKTDVSPPASATFRERPPLKLGTQVVVFGYPRLDFLTSTGNLVDGLVSALAGPNDYAGMIQISAPVQSGNSGGAVLDSSGNVVAVVVAKTNADLDQGTGEIFQQVNFAISGDVAKSYLIANGVAFNSAASEAKSEFTDIADKAKGFTAVVQCEPQ